LARLSNPSPGGRERGGKVGRSKSEFREALRRTCAGWATGVSHSHAYESKQHRRLAAYTRAQAACCTCVCVLYTCRHLSRRPDV